MTRRAIAFRSMDAARVRRAFLWRRLAAGDCLQRAGEVPRYAAFVASGCLRHYVIDARGKEHIVQFAPETWWLADATSLAQGTPSSYFFEAIEDSEALLLDGAAHQALVTEVPGTRPPSAPGCSATPRPRTSASSAR
jgi:CRP-like cAMP-binding protein